MTATALIADRQPFFVVHKLSFGRTIYLTDRATWSRSIHQASAFETHLDAVEYAEALHTRFMGHYKVSPIEYSRNGDVGVFA